jgi:hypothetical protein
VDKGASMNYLAIMPYIDNDDRLQMFSRPVKTDNDNDIETYMLAQAGIDKYNEFRIIILAKDPT